MKQAIWKNGPYIFVAVAMVLSFYALKRIMSTPEQVRPPENLSYEMPRPKSLDVGYDISGRRIIRNIRSLPPKQKPAAKVIATAKPTTTTVDPKKAQAEAKKKAEEARKKALAQRKTQMSVQVAQNSNQKMSGFEPVNSNPPAPSNSGSGAAARPQNPEVVPETVTKKSRKSVEEWRSLLYSQPTPKNGTDFAKAYKDNEIEAVAFYKITEELLADSNPQRQQLAVFILKQDSSVRTFSVLSAHASDGTSEAVKIQIEQALKTYAEPSKFAILNRVLVSPDARASTMARKILGDAIAAHDRSGGPSPTGRDARGYSLGTSTPGQFDIFLQTLEQLSGNSDPTVAQDAQKLLDSIKALKSSTV